MTNDYGIVPCEVLGAYKKIESLTLAIYGIVHAVKIKHLLGNGRHFKMLVEHLPCC